MGYRYNNLCLDTVEELYQVISAGCPIVSGNGSSSIKCTPTATDITITVDQIPTTGNPIQQSYIPELIACDSAPVIAEVIELSWLVISVWVVAWGIKKSIDAIKGKS